MRDVHAAAPSRLLILAADFLYWISGVAYRGEGHPPSDWHVTFNTVTFFGGWILFGLLLLGEFVAWAAKPRERTLN